MTRRLVVFLGPTLPRAEAKKLAPRADFRPPARQGDVWRALESQPAAIALIDGVFESQPAVWHHELRAALDSGIAVFGASSMGALRAAELQPFGMIGIGEVFRGFAAGRLEDDAEVALLHADAEHAFRPLTVPLVNLRHSIATALKLKSIDRRLAQRLLRNAIATDYHQRQWPAELPPVLRLDLKAADARECLTAASGFVTAGAMAPVANRSNPSSFVRRSRLTAVHREALQKLAGNTALEDAGTRTLLLAAWGRSMGLQAPSSDIARWERKLRRTVRDQAERFRLAEAFALEESMLQRPEQLLPDGPARMEGLYAASVR